VGLPNETEWVLHNCWVSQPLMLDRERASTLQKLLFRTWKTLNELSWLDKSEKFEHSYTSYSLGKKCFRTLKTQSFGTFITKLNLTMSWSIKYN